MSCGKAREVFNKTNIAIDEEVDAKKETIGADKVWDVLSRAEKVHVASGKNVLTYQPGEENREELIAKATGRTGNLRAPALRIGTELYIGFNGSIYEGVL